MSSHHDGDLADTLEFFPVGISSARDLSVEDWCKVMERIADFLFRVGLERRENLFNAARRTAVSMHRADYAKAKLWFFLHVNFDVFEEFWQHAELRRVYAAYFYRWLRCTLRDGGFSRKHFKRMTKISGTSPHKNLARMYGEVLQRSFRFCTLKAGGHIEVVTDPFSIVPEPTLQEILRKTEVAILTSELKQLDDRLNSGRKVRGYERVLGYDAGTFPVITEVEWLFPFADDLFLTLDLSGMEVTRSGKYGWGPILTVQHHIEGLLRRGRWPTVTEETDVDRIPYKLIASQVEYTLDKPLLRQLYDGLAGQIFDEIQNIRRIRHGRLPIGLKVHYTGVLNPTQANLEPSGFHLEDRKTAILPPVGSVAAAEKVLIRAGELLGVNIFGGDAQIQVCSAGELTPRRAAILGACSYVGSDRLKRFALDSFRSASHATGSRMIIYGAGVMEASFEWWSERSTSGVIVKQVMLPDACSSGLQRRTDVLGCMSMLDVDNVNLIATLLTHAQYGGYWKELGLQFEKDVEDLFAQHGLSHVLASSWTQAPGFSNVAQNGDAEMWFAAFSELMDYAFADRERVLAAAERGDHVGARSGILFEMQSLLEEYRFTVESAEEEVVR